MAAVRRLSASLTLALLIWNCAAAAPGAARVEAPAPRGQEPLETAAQFQGPDAERFLQRARVRAMRDIGTGVTLPQRATLALDGTERSAVFKTIDVKKPGISQFGRGSEMNFQDSWKCELPAYVIDRMIGLQMVPATVERTINGQQGSLQWWVQSVMSEADRLKKSAAPPDPEAFERRMLKMYLFDELIANVDRHLNNVLITADFDLRLIDHSRSFRATRELKDPAKLTRFSKSLLDGIATLEYQELRKRTVRWLEDGQIRAVLIRRDAILALAKQAIAERGEAAVIYP
jgi:hypothetical protein